MEKLYTLVDLEGRILTSSIFRTKESANKLLYELDCGGYDADIKEVEVKFAKRSVCFLHLYSGYDYGIDSMYDVISQSEIFSCSEEAKKHRWWTQAVERYKECPENHFMDDNLICSYDADLDEKFYYGDVMECKFRLSIERLKVRR